MSRRRKNDGPPARPADPAAVGVAPSSADPREVERLLVRYQLTIRRRLPVLLLSLCSGLLLTLIFEPINWHGLAWVALLPWIVAIATSQRWGWMLFCSWLTGFLFFAVNLYWLLACGYPGPAGSIALMALAQLALSAFMGLHFMLFAYVVGGLVRRWGRPGQPALPSGLLLTYLVPIAWVATEVIRGYVLSGFPWFLLGHSMALQPSLIQVADLGGAYAVSFIIAAVNGLLADGMLQPLFLPTRKGPRPNYQVSAAALAVGGLVLATIVYGRYRIEQFSPAGYTPRIAVIQSDVRITLDNEGVSRAETFRQHLALSQRAAQSRAAIVAWPETMVPTYVNDELLGLDFEPDLDDWMAGNRAVDRILADQALQYDVVLVVGGSSLVATPAEWARGRTIRASDFDAEPAGRPSMDNPQIQRFNSAIVYQPIFAPGQPAAPPGATTVGEEIVRPKLRYDKHHLVPFGELIPFRESWPGGFRLLRKLTPMGLLNAGTRTEPLMATTRDGATVLFATPICYEDVVPQATRPLVYGPDGSKRAQFLLNISNDGWFGGTTELEQHWALSLFRCVENRVPMARSVNCGCSGFFDSLGRPIPQPGRPLGRLEPGEIGSLSAVLPLDDRVTVYSRIGDLPGWVLVVLLGIGGAVVMFKRREAKRAARRGK